MATRQVVIVEREEGLFEPRDVKLGRSIGRLTKCLSGLKVGERIVITGNFLIDSESNLRASLKGLTPARRQAMIARSSVGRLATSCWW